ncbi:uncharacterized mitochondrial protein AtMg00810-like [Nicotiana sylvestris]|uniref:uncharacterized mitochondrial protein AtMg00810-like n=1 Tax=Nicotiana sylvestris TaxID=4096 RepID=UPI00388C69E3
MDDGIFISQESYTKEILKKFNMLDCNPVNTPMESGTKLSKFDEGEKVDPTFFKSFVGSLRYLTCTISDILFVVGVVSRFMEAPTSTHLKVVRRILCYLKAEYVVAMSCTCHAIWLRRLLKELNLQQIEATEISIDNKSAQEG